MSLEAPHHVVQIKTKFKGLLKIDLILEESIFVIAFDVSLLQENKIILNKKTTKYFTF